MNTDRCYRVLLHRPRTRMKTSDAKRRFWWSSLALRTIVLGKKPGSRR
jgi:hypothetical protein